MLAQLPQKRIALKEFQVQALRVLSFRFRSFYRLGGLNSWQPGPGMGQTPPGHFKPGGLTEPIRQPIPSANQNRQATKFYYGHEISKVS